MQRSISNKNSLVIFAYVISLIGYESLTSIYLFLPPMLAVLFVFFINALDKEYTLGIFISIVCFVIFETQMGYPLFSSIIYFGLIYKFVIPRLRKNLDCSSCIKATYVLLAYIGYYLFLLLLSNIFLLPMPNISYYVIYYMIIEFFIVSIL